MTDKNHELAKVLLTLTLEELIKRIKDGVATAAELAVAHKMCKDAGLSMLPTPTNPMGQLAAHFSNLPFPSTGEDCASH